MQRYKLALINHHIDAIVCPSRWVAQQAKQAGVNREIKIIPNAVDTSVFCPRDKRELKQELGLPLDQPVVVLVTMSFTNPYKGTSHACEALAKLQRGINVLVVGLKADRISFPEGPNYIFRERTFDRELLAKYFGASDLLLFPSMAETSGLVLLESMACGTPAIAFSTGGIVEIVDHLSNGWLAPRGDSTALAYGLAKAISDTEMRLSWSTSARAKVMSMHTESTFLQSHLELYDELLTKPRAQPKAE